MLIHLPEVRKRGGRENPYSLPKIILEINLNISNTLNINRLNFIEDKWKNAKSSDRLF